MGVLGELLTARYVKCDVKISYKSLTSYYYFVLRNSKFTDM
jgi:hypothetical protein